MEKVLSVSQMKIAEKKIIDSEICEFQLMEIAVKGIVEKLDKSLSTIIVCGFGNNAGDGLGIAEKLHILGVDVSVMLLNKNLKNSAEIYHKKCVEIGVKFIDFIEDFNFGKFQQVIDCIFGIGFHGEAEGIYAKAILAINQTAKYVVSIDIPSGINPDTGLTSLAVKCNKNIAVGALKTGLILNQAKDYIGENVISDLALDYEYLGENVTKFDFKEMFSPRQNYSHKGNFGYVGIIGGSFEFSGAAKLANSALVALRSGCGVSRLIIPDCIAQAVLPNITVSTLFALPTIDGYCKFDEKALEKSLEKLDAVAIGMGMTCNEEVFKIASYILKNYSIKVILDADAINSIAKFGNVETLLSKTNCKVVLTPHLKEFSRLCGKSVEEIKNNSIILAKEFAKNNKVVLLLKGTCSIVTDGEKTYFVSSGCGGMATAGSGDVLDGILVGLCGYNDANSKTIACGALINGLAGEMAQNKFGSISMISSDTANCIASVIKEFEDKE